DEVRHPQAPAAPTGPFLELLITKLAQQPAPLGGGAVNVGNPQLDVMHGSNERLGHASFALRIGWGEPLRYRPLRSRGATYARGLRRRPIVRLEAARRRRPLLKHCDFPSENVAISLIRGRPNGIFGHRSTNPPIHQ